MAGRTLEEEMEEARHMYRIKMSILKKREAAGHQQPEGPVGIVLEEAIKTDQNQTIGQPPGAQAKRVEDPSQPISQYPNEASGDTVSMEKPHTPHTTHPLPMHNDGQRKSAGRFDPLLAKFLDEAGRSGLFLPTGHGDRPADLHEFSQNNDALDGKTASINNSQSSVNVPQTTDYKLYKRGNAPDQKATLASNAVKRSLKNVAQTLNEKFQFCTVTPLNEQKHVVKEFTRAVHSTYQELTHIGAIELEGWLITYIKSNATAAKPGRKRKKFKGKGVNKTFVGYVDIKPRNQEAVHQRNERRKAHGILTKTHTAPAPRVETGTLAPEHTALKQVKPVTLKSVQANEEYNELYAPNNAKATDLTDLTRLTDNSIVGVGIRGALDDYNCKTTFDSFLAVAMVRCFVPIDTFVVVRCLLPLNAPIAFNKEPGLWTTRARET
jgi:hypothetical protein